MSIVFDTPLLSPLNVGLYRAANVVQRDDPTRLGTGVDVRSLNCSPGGVGLWEIAACADNGAVLKEAGDHASTTPFEGWIVWASDECDLSERSRREIGVVARQKLLLNEQVQVEAGFDDVLLGLAGAPVAVSAGTYAEVFVRAVGDVEDALGLVPGVIHADLRFLAVAERFNLVDNQMRSPAGHVWAFGPGYAFGNVLVGSGPVHVLRGPVGVSEAIETTKNVRQVIAEREVVPTTECAVVAVSF